MAWTYASLKLAINALNPVPPDLASIAAAINAQTTTTTGVSFTWQSARTIAQTSVNASWSRIIVRARETPARPPVTLQDMAILTAINAVSMDGSLLVEPSNAAAWAAFQSGLGALQAVGDLIASDVAAISLLTQATIPKWQPAVNTGDIQTAQVQP